MHIFAFVCIAAPYIIYAEDESVRDPYLQPSVLGVCGLPASVLPSNTNAEAAVVAFDWRHITEPEFTTEFELSVLDIAEDGHKITEYGLEPGDRPLVDFSCTETGIGRLQVWAPTSDAPAKCSWYDISYTSALNGDGEKRVSVRDLPEATGCSTLYDAPDFAVVGTTQSAGTNTVLFYDTTMLDYEMYAFAAVNISEHLVNASDYSQFVVTSIECDKPSALCFVGVDAEVWYGGPYTAAPYLMVLSLAALPNVTVVDLMPLAPGESSCSEVMALAMHNESRTLYAAVTIEVGQTGYCADGPKETVIVPIEILGNSTLERGVQRTIPTEPSSSLARRVDAMDMDIAHVVVDGVPVPRLLVSGQLVQTDILGFETDHPDYRRAFLFAADLALEAYTAFEGLSSDHTHPAVFSHIDTLASGDVIASGVFGMAKTWVGFNMSMFAANLTGEHFCCLPIFSCMFCPSFNDRTDVRLMHCSVVFVLNDDRAVALVDPRADSCADSRPAARTNGGADAGADFPDSGAHSGRPS